MAGSSTFHAVEEVFNVVHYRTRQPEDCIFFIFIYHAMICHGRGYACPRLNTTGLGQRTHLLNHSSRIHGNFL
jgi:hypothetical protein